MRSLGEVIDTARIALNRSATDWFIRIDGLEQLLLAWTSSDAFVPAAQLLLDPLWSGNGALLRTLSAYLDHESALAPTALALGCTTTPWRPGCTERNDSSAST